MIKSLSFDRSLFHFSNLPKTINYKMLTIVERLVAFYRLIEKNLNNSSKHNGVLCIWTFSQAPSRTIEPIKCLELRRRFKVLYTNLKMFTFHFFPHDLLAPMALFSHNRALIMSLYPISHACNVSNCY